MDVLSLCPLPAAPLVWELLPGRWVLTVVCKATYRIEPGLSPLAQEHEPLWDTDKYWDDDASRSIRVPSDLIPFKPRADVVLVGSAFAKGSSSVRSLVARVAVGSVDKSIEVMCARVRTRDGELREGKRWTKMPISYERAARSADNPVGIGAGSPRDPYGQLPLPCVYPVGASSIIDKPVPSIGLGPISPDWPLRKRARGQLPPDHPVELAPFGEGFDAAFFQAAPPDQQTDTIKPNERITLEHLHARHASLVTSLPGVAPRARVEIPGTAPREMTLAGDTLWIDTDAGICTVTFRAKVDLTRPDQDGRVLVALAKPTESIPWAKLAPAPPPPKSLPPVQTPTKVPPPPPVGSSTAVGTVSLHTNFRKPSQPPAPPPPPAPAMAPLPMAPPPPPIVDEISDSDLDVEITLSEEPARLLEQTSAFRAVTKPFPKASAEVAALPFQPAPPGYQPPAAFPSKPPVPAPPAMVENLAAFAAPSRRHTIPDWAEVGSPPPPDYLPPIEPSKTPAPPPLLTATAPWAPLASPPAPIPPLLPAPPDGPFGVLEASNAAVRGADIPPPRTSESEVKSVEPRPQPTPIQITPVELIWFDPMVGALLPPVENGGTPNSTSPQAANPADDKGANAKPGETPAQSEKAKEDLLAELLKTRVYEALTRGVPIAASAVESALESAEEESPPRPAFVLLSGTLEMSLDDVEALKATVAAASPLAPSDKKLKEAIDVANEMLKTPMLGMPDFAQGLAQRIRDAWTKVNRALPADHLTTCTERLLLEQRSYQKRDLLDDTWIRAQFYGTPTDPFIPLYLPIKIAKRLPLFRRFSARILVEVVWQQDQYESCPVALRAWALGRLPNRSRPRVIRKAT
ncbi:MAG: DUF2169 domain-containing protein [Polyangiaceae bacterium]|nr:DUF2169 domain-containing protein [Polyangiaceae bacterium]